MPPSRSDHSRSNASAIAFGSGVVTSPGLGVADELERASAVGERHDRSRGCERLDRDVAVVLVVGTEEDAERASIELVQPFVRDADLEPDPVLERRARGLSSGATARRGRGRRARA